MVMDSISHLKRYVNDAFAFIKKGFVENVLCSGFEFFPWKYPVYIWNRKSEEVTISRCFVNTRENKTETTVYRKSANNGNYLN